MFWTIQTQNIDLWHDNSIIFFFNQINLQTLYLCICFEIHFLLKYPLKKIGQIREFLATNLIISYFINLNILILLTLIFFFYKVPEAVRVEEEPEDYITIKRVLGGLTRSLLLPVRNRSGGEPPPPWWLPSKRHPPPVGVAAASVSSKEIRRNSLLSASLQILLPIQLDPALEVWQSAAGFTSANSPDAKKCTPRALTSKLTRGLTQVIILSSFF